MSDDGRPSITTAQSPFDDVDADIILHTSDHVDFRVFRRILTLSSPFFQGMFTLPQPSTSSAFANGCNLTRNENKHSDKMTNTPSVDVPEDSKTLDTLLRFLYPNTHVYPFHDLTHACNVATTASKYAMSVALDKIADKIQAQYVASHPLDVYFIAWRMGWEDVAKAAARYCLDSTLVMETMVGDQSDGDALVRSGLLDFPGATVAYRRLESYRFACRKVLEESMREITLIEFEGDYDEESADMGISARCLELWMMQYSANIAQVVPKCPRKDIFDQLDLTPKVKCTGCNIDVATAIATMHLTFSSVIERVLSEIELRFGS